MELEETEEVKLKAQFVFTQVSTRNMCLESLSIHFLKYTWKLKRNHKG